MPSEALREALEAWLNDPDRPTAGTVIAFTSGWHLALRHVQKEAERRHLVDLAAWIERLLMEK